MRKWEGDVRQRRERATPSEVGVCALDMCLAPWRWGRVSRRVSYSLRDNHPLYDKAHGLDNKIQSFEVMIDQGPD